jgi:DNA-binding NarL/FixJ family response regulator
MKIRVAIADDHPLVINGLRFILSNCADIEIIASYANGAELLRGFTKQLPDVLLLDIHMPGQTGEELADIISAQFPTVRMLALTNLDNVYYIKSMMRRGVYGYILKTSREQVLLDAIRTVNKGEKYLETQLQEKVLQDSLQARQQLSANPILSWREKEILQLIATNLTSQQIAEKLAISKRTVDSYRLSLLTKLGAKNVAALVRKGIQLGLIG